MPDLYGQSFGSAFQNAAVANGNGIAMSVGGLAAVSVNIAGLGGNGTVINFEGLHTDGMTDWQPLMAVNTSGVSAQTATANGVYQVATNGVWHQMRCRISAWAVDTVTVKGRGSLTGVGGSQVSIVGAVAIAVPPLAGIFSAAATGAAAAAVADLLTAITANKIFQGMIAIQAAASQTAALAGAGTVRIIVTWVPGTGGTPGQIVAALNLQFGLGGITNLQAPTVNGAIVIPVQLYVGTTAGKFTVTALATGSVTAQQWDVFVNGTAQ